MNLKMFVALKHQFRRWAVLGALLLVFSSASSILSLDSQAIAVSLYSPQALVASSTANQVKGQVDQADRAIDSIKEKLGVATEKTQDLVKQTKGKVQKDITKAKSVAKDSKAAVDSKAKRDIAKTQEAAEKAKATVASRVKQDSEKTGNVLEQAGNKAGEFASNALNTAKDLLGQ